MPKKTSSPDDYDGTMPLSNVRQEEFCQLVARGKSFPEAYAGAGFSSKNLHSNSARFAKDYRIRKRIEALVQEISSKAIIRAVIDRDFVLTGLKGLATSEKVRDTARVRAYELLGKELGMFREAIDHKFQWDGDPAKLTKEQLEKLTKALEEQTFGDDVAAAAAAREAAIKGMVQ